MPSFDPKLMREVSRLYHEDLRTRGDIAQETKTDPRIVTKLLEEAKRRRLVKVDPIPKTDEGLDHALQRRYPCLKEVLIVPGDAITTPEQYSHLLQEWGRISAGYFEDLVDKACSPLRVGISGGETLLEFVNAVRPDLRENVSVYATALVGRGLLLTTGAHVDPIVNATVLWSKCGRRPDRCRYATLPPYSEEIANERNLSDISDAISSEMKQWTTKRSIRDVVKDMDSINVAFVGLGLVNPEASPVALTNQVTMTGLLKAINRQLPKLLSDNHAIAEVAYCFFDEHGSEQPSWRIFITAGHYDAAKRGVKFYKSMVTEGKKVIVIAGAHKEVAIRAALDAGLFNVWITNEDAARKVLAMPRITKTGG